MATNCGITTGLNAIDQCFSSSSGGVKKFYVANFAEVSAVTDSNSVITEIVMSGTAKFQTYQPNLLSSNFTSDGSGGSVADGTVGNNYKHMLSAKFSKSDSVTLNTLKLAARTRQVLIVENPAGELFMLGKNMGMILKPNYESGTEITNFQGFTLNYESVGETENFSTVALSALTAVLA